MHGILSTGAPSAPTSLPQAVLLKRSAAVLDILLNEFVLPNPGAWGPAGKAANFIDDFDNAKTAICGP